MRRFLLAFTLLAAVAVPAVATVDTTTISGTVYLAGGATATGGSVTCSLSDAGSVDDGDGDSQRVASRASATVGATGAIEIELVPNDVITPSGTYYTCRFLVSGASDYQRASWTEKWQVDSTPDPVDLGSVTRLEVEPGLTVGEYLLYVATAPSGDCTANEAPRYVTGSGGRCVCSSGAWSCVQGWGATPVTADAYASIATPDSTGKWGLVVENTETGNHHGVGAMRFRAEVDATDTAARRVYGAYGSTYVTTDANVSGTSAYGGFFTAYSDDSDYATDATIQDFVGVFGQTTFIDGPLASGNAFGVLGDAYYEGPDGGVTGQGAAVAADSPVVASMTVPAHAGFYVADQTASGITQADAILIEAQTTNAGVTQGNLRLAGGGRTSGHLQLGDLHIWITADGFAFDVDGDETCDLQLVSGGLDTNCDGTPD